MVNTLTLTNTCTRFYRFQFLPFSHFGLIDQSLIIRFFFSGGLPRYRKSAEQGIVDAQHKLALLYKEGRGVPRTGGEAAWWFLKAADQGHAGAASNLGEMYKLASTRAPPPLSQDLQPKRSNSP